MNRILIAVAAVLVLIVGAVLVGPGLVDWNRYRGAISAQVEEAVGRAVVIAGDIEFSVLPQLALSARNVHIINSNGASAADLASVRSLEIRIALAPLLRGEIQVREVVLMEPVLDLEILPGGQPNWAFFDPQSGEDGSPFSVGLAQGLRVDKFIAQDGTITFRDPAKGIVERIDDVNAEITAEAGAGPFFADGAFSLRGIPVAFTFASGALDTGRPSALRLDISFTESGDAVGFSGAYVNQGGPRGLTGDLRLTGADFGATVRSVFRAWGAVPPQTRGFGVAFSAQAKTDWAPDEAGFNDINLKLGAITGGGAVNVALGAAPRFDATLALSRIDLDAVLARAAAEAPSVEAVLGIEPTFRLPAGLNGSLALGIEAASFRQRSMRQINLVAEFAGGAIEISKAAALLPGVTDVSATGVVRAVDGKPQFDGEVRGRSDNLRDLLVWLGKDRASVPADRLRTLAFAGQLRTRPDLIQAYGFDLRFDTTRVSGAAAYALRERPAFSVDVAVDRIDLDSYRRRVLPVDALAAAAGPDPEGAPEDAAPPPWAVLTQFDTDIKVRLAELVYNEEQVQAIALDLGLLNGVLTVREATVADLAGAALSLTGIAGGFDARIGGGGNIKVTAEDPTGLAQLAGLDLGPSAARLGPMVFNASVDGDQDKLSVDLGMTADGMDLWLRGSLAALAEDPSVDVAFGAGHPSLAELVQALGLPASGAQARMFEGPVALRGTAAGTLRDLQVGLTGQLAGADIGLVGAIGWADAVAYRFQGSLSHDHAALVLAGLGLGPGEDPAFGPMQARGAMDGNGQRAALTGLEATIGPTEITGEAALGFGGERPKFTANLAVTELDLARFLPASMNRGRSDGEGRRNWSVEPISFAALAAIDLDLDLKADALAAFGLAFADASLRARSKDGVLEVEEFFADALGGELGLSLRVADGAVPSVRGELELVGVDLALVPGLRWDLGLAAGAADARLALETVGASERELVANLAGTIELAAADGLLDGFSLEDLHARLGTVKDVAELNSLVQPAMNGGQTAFDSLDASARVRGGVMVIEALSAVLAIGALESTGTIDLPRRRAAFDLAFLFTEFPDAPPLGLSLSGPWDAPRRAIDSQALAQYVAARPPVVMVLQAGAEPAADAPPEAVPVPVPEPEPAPVAAAPEPEPAPEPAPAPIAAAPEPEPEPVAAAPEPEPEPVAAAPEPEPAPAPIAAPAPPVAPAAPAPIAPVMPGPQPGAPAAEPDGPLTPEQRLKNFLQGLGGLAGGD